MATKTLQFSHPVGTFRDSVRAYREYKKKWKRQVVEEYAELKAEAEHAKEDPFYQRGMVGLACEPVPMPQPEFKRGSFVNAIRKQRIHQQEWQEQINRKLDEREEQHRIAMEKWQLEMEEA